MLAQHIDMTNEAYHAHEAIGASMIETFRHSRREYHARYIAKTEPPKESPAMAFGTLVHLLVLEPELAESRIADPFPDVAPDGKKWLRRKGSDHEKWWQEELDKREGMLQCDAEDLQRARDCVAAIKDNEKAAAFFARKGKPEYSIFWTDAASGLACKCRVDWMSSVAVDLKTTRDATPAEYAKQLVQLGYARKKAHYEAGLRALFGDKAPPFIHIAVESVAPHRVANYELDDRDKEGYSLGEGQRRTLLHWIAKCMESGDWREPWERKPITLQLPSWAFHEDSYQFSGE